MPRNYLYRPSTPEELDFWVKLSSELITVQNKFSEGMVKIIKEAREKAGISLIKLAKLLASIQSIISEVEN